MTLYVYPRLPRAVARRLLEDLAAADPESARSRATLAHPAAAPVATGPPIVPASVIADTADKVRALATRLGYPTPMSRSTVARFDQPCGDVLVEEMHIIPADAASEDVWSFMTLVVLPDVAVWRFPDLLPERFLGMPRNTFRRVWWRSFTLEAANQLIPGGPEPLGEDELVNIFERPSLSRSASVARAIARAVRGLDGSQSRTAAMRELAKRMRRLVSIISLDVITAAELEAIIADELDQAVRALSRISTTAGITDEAAVLSEADLDGSAAGDGDTESLKPSRRETEWPITGSPDLRMVAERMVPPADEDRISELFAGRSVRMVLRTPGGLDTISAELAPHAGIIRITYGLLGHNDVSGNLRRYTHEVEGGPAAAIAWVRLEHEAVLAGQRPAPIRNLRDELD